MLCVEGPYTACGKRGRDPLIFSAAVATAERTNACVGFPPRPTHMCYSIVATYEKCDNN